MWKCYGDDKRISKLDEAKAHIFSLQRVINPTDAGKVCARKCNKIATISISYSDRVMSMELIECESVGTKLNYQLCWKQGIVMNDAFLCRKLEFNTPINANDSQWMNAFYYTYARDTLNMFSHSFKCDERTHTHTEKAKSFSFNSLDNLNVFSKLRVALFHARALTIAMNVHDKTNS